MKSLFNIKWYSGLFMAVILCVLSSCSPDSLDGELGAVPESGDVTFTATPDASNPNIIHYKNTGKGFVSVWDLGNSTTVRGSEVTGTYPVKGDYKVTLTILTDGGNTSASKTINIAATNPLMLNIPVYNFLTGGADALEGKTWMVDKDSKGHLGIGPATSAGPDWYAAAPNDKNGKEIYDDEMTFQLGGFAFNYNAHGKIYVNEGFGSQFPGAVKENGGNDFIAPYTSPANMTWSLSEVSKDKWQLTLSNGGHLGYYVGSTSYEILSINENELYVRQIQGNVADNAWYQKFIRKGYTRPVVAPEYKIEDIKDNFEGTGNASYTNDSGGSLITYDNPATIGSNTSAKVGKYVKGDGNGGAFANIQIRKDYKLDITERNKFKLKVFIPSYNDYTKTGGESWQSYQTLQKQVSMKLQNGDLEGNAYTTQAEVKFTGQVTDQWLELEFDFSDFKDRTDFDQIVIQIGGEGIYTGGTFFIDDLELLK